MVRGVLGAILAALMLTSELVAPAHAAPMRQANAATLSVMAGQVEVAPPGGSFARGSDGQTVSIGGRVRTGADGRAALTFFDGTTAALDPSTEITLDRVEPSGNQGGLLAGIGLAVGRVWAQVSSLVERGSSVEVQAGATTAVGREGVTGYRRDADGTVICWDIDGAPMRIRTPAGEIEVQAGQQVSFPGGQPGAGPVPRVFGRGLLEVQTEGPILARLVDPDNLTVGFPLDDLVVNQILDAWSSLPTDQPRFFRVPGPVAGVHRLVLQSFSGGPYRVRVVMTDEGRELFAREWGGTARAGESQLVDLMVESRGGISVVAGLNDPRPLVGEPPGQFVYP